MGLTLLQKIPAIFLPKEKKHCKMWMQQERVCSKSRTKQTQSAKKTEKEKSAALPKKTSFCDDALLSCTLLNWYPKL